MTLFEECIVALEKKNVLVLSKDETNKIFECMAQSFPITPWGQIDWKNVKHKKISSSDQITKYINIQDEVYILWDNASIPSIKTNLNQILKALDDVTAVSFDTWLYNPTMGYIIEFYHEGDITIGWTNL